MNNVIAAFITVAILTIWLFGWAGIGVLLLFILVACCCPKRKPGKIQMFVEKLGTGK